MFYQERESMKKRDIYFEALRGRRSVFVTALLCVVITNLLDFIAPQVVRLTVDSVIGNLAFPEWAAGLADALGGRDNLRSNIWICGLIVALAAALSAVTGFIRSFFTLEPAEHIAQNLRDKMFGHVQRLPFNWHVNAQTGDIIQRSTTDVDMVRNFTANTLPEFVRSLVMIVATAAIMLMMDPVMTLAGVCLMPLFAITGVIYHKKISKTWLALDEAEGMLQAAVQENLSGVRVVRAFGRERFEIDRFDEKNNHYFKKAIKMGNGLASFWSFSDMIGILQMFLVVIVGLVRVLNGDLTVGTFLTFYMYTQMLIWPARETGRHISDMAKCSISLGRIQDVLNSEPEKDPESPADTPISGDITFEKVTFGYGDEPVLKNVSFTLTQGQVLGVLGSTGSGKSTLAYLLTRLYDLPEGSGRITINGVDIQSFSREHIRRNVAMVLQEPFLYSKTVGENIRAATSGERTAMERAARTAVIHDTILELGGYDTKVGERGVTLSGGQKQRVAIARMLLQDAPIMIFDDSLSAVDTQTDAQIRKALREHTSHATVIIISHRISTLMEADKILVLNDGAVEAVGSHAELVKGENTYRRVYELQSAII
jgi:ATP-binding cassette subfamily B protein